MEVYEGVLQELVVAGLTPREALEAATIAPALRVRMRRKRNGHKIDNVPTKMIAKPR